VGFLTGVKPAGGGDAPEDINGGLREVLKLEWANPTKCLIHFADAPCHGKRFHTFHDEYPEGGSKDIAYDKIFTELKSLGVEYYFMSIDKGTDKMVEEFQKIWRESGVYQSNVGRLPDFTVKMMKDTTAKDFVVMVKETVMASMKKTATAGVKSMRRSMMKKEYKMDDVIKEDLFREEFDSI